jgi:beta-galactosidase
MNPVIFTSQSRTCKGQLRFNFSRPERLASYHLKATGMSTALAVLVLLCAVLCSGGARAQQVEPSLPLSQRFTINLAGGMPEYIGDASSSSNAPQSHWWFENANSSTSYSTPGFLESSSGNWQQVGLPYDANISRTFINQTSGGGQGSLTGNDNWYRLHFKVDPKYATQKFILEIEGSHTGVQVYINGTLLPGISAVAADAQATHVVGFVPVAVDLTPYLHADGSTDNVIAIDVSRGNTWFEQPNFSGAFRFGQAMAGLFRNVKLFVTNPVHIPINVYSNQKTWGTYVGTKSITAGSQGTANAASAIVEVQTNVLNESATTQQVTLTTQIVDANGDVVVTAPPITQAVAPMTAGSFPSTEQAMFQQQISVPNPTLWYPNNSVYGKPYMYKVYHIVSVNGVVVDSVQSPLGIRVITWDNNFPSFNGHPMYLWGASGRYDYPALGSAVPDEQVWRDLAQFAASGGNIWRPGHSTSSEEFVEAADAYGIMIDQPSGDGEGSFTNPTADDQTLKTEIHRDMIIRDRSHPSILDWEEDNGGNNLSLISTLASLETQWDNINPRQQATRAYLPSYANYVSIDECDGAGCESGIKQSNPSKPAFGAEYWDNVGTGRGLAWDNELAFAAPYLNDWRNGRVNNTFGMAQWYFADTPGEISTWSEFNGNDNLGNYVRSLGYSMVDQNRFPRLLYYIYQANWTPFSINPVVALAHHWNRAYEYTAGTPIQENAFSNCPAVRLLINGVNKDPLTGAILADQTPNPWNIQSGGDLTQNTTVMPGQVHWMVNWAPGTVTAACVDSNGNLVPNVTDSRTTAGAENKIVLKVVPELQKPDGTSFQWTSNGSDAAFVTAEVQDAQGNLVPTAADNVTFTVSGPATYMGGTEQVVADPVVTNYFEDAFSEANSNVINGLPYAFFHSPGDPELNFEGGLTKVALRSTFTPGVVTVTATTPGLVSSTVQLNSVAPPALVQSQAPSIIVPPVSTSITAGQSATFTVAATGSGALNYQWYLGNTAIAGATGISYTTPATTLADNNETFMVTVTSASGYGAVTSNPVTLSVVAPANATITTQPASQTAVVGQTATLSVVASGSPELNYVWYEDNVQVANGPQNNFTTPVLAAAGTHTFYVVVSNPLNNVQSSNAVLTVNAATPVSFVTQPANQIAATNQPVQLTAVVAGSAPYTYQWQFTPNGGSATIVASDTQLSNAISYVIPAITAANVGAYSVTVNNAANVPITSAAAQLTLAPPGNNLALGRPATSSSSQNACNDGTTAPPFSGVGCLGAENAVDGNLTSRWGSATAGAPPTPLIPGVDPSWLQVDLGSTQSFNTVVIIWENASAAQYQIQYTNADPATNPVWSIATTNNAGAGGTETLTFPTVQARYVRLYGTQRNTQYGYSLYEFQVYNIAQLGASTERYSTSSANPSLVVDNMLGLTWTSTIKTDTAIGSQFTGVDAVAYCSSLNMRIPTQAEALDISGINNSSRAFPGPWNTWTSTLDPNDANQTAIVHFDGSVEEKVTVNWPGETLCTVGTSSAQAAAILAQPQAYTATVGQSAMFTVAATGTPSPSYQWLENGNAIPGATSAAYITQPTTIDDNGAIFSVIVSNGENTITSNVATLTVTNGPVATGPTIATQPASQTVAAGSQAHFTVVAGGTGPFTYQWFRNGAAIVGATGAAYTTPTLSAADSGSVYSVKVSNASGSITSANATLTVTGAGLTITAQPVSQTVASGATAQFTVVAGGTGPFTYQWFRNGAAIVGATGAAYTTPTLSAGDSGSVYSVTVSNASGSVTSVNASLTVTNNQTSGTVNLALGKPATSSGNENGGLGPLNAVDGNLTTRWSSAFVDPSWLEVDLGSPVNINNVVLRWENAYGKAYQIQVSNDGQTWTTVYTQTAGLGGVETLTFPTVVDRYIRMYGTARATQYGYSLFEFEVYGPTLPTIVTQPVSQTVVAGSQAQFTVVAGGNGPFTYQWMLNGVAIVGATSATYTTPAASSSDNGDIFSVTVSNASGSVTSANASLTVTNPTPGITNLALGKPATSSGNENGGLGPLNAVDGNLTTRWSSAFVDPSWLEVDLGAPTIINKVVLYWENAYGKVYQIQVSNDEQTWITVYTQTAGQGGVETLTFPTVIDRYIRFFGTTRATQYGYSLFEFQVYGADVPSITTQPASQTVNAGATATFSVTAAGDGPFTYQWLRNGVAIPGANATSYTTPALTSADNGSVFTVNVTNASGTNTSMNAVVTVSSGAPTGTNLALNQPTKESGSQNDANLGSANAVDGNLTTRWSSAFVDPSWIEVDLGSPKTIGQVVLRWENAYGKAYQIQVSNDEQTWTTAFTQTNGKGGVEDLTFPPVSGRYVRMFGTARSSQYGYSLYEFEVYAAASAPTISTQPASQTVNAGATAIFTVVAGGTGPFTYQWYKGSNAIPGATAASYTTPTLAATDNGGQYSVTVGNATGTVTSAAATLTVNNSGSGYTIYPGFVGVDLNNNTNGAWADNQVYVTVIGIDPGTNKFAYLTPAGTIVDFTLGDASAANHLTGPNGQNYGNYSFTLAQSKLLKIPTFISARAYISLGNPLYVQVNGDGNGNVTGYAGPNPQNATDPNINTHFDWYEFNNNNGIFINTTQVDEFGLPLLLDVWGAGGTFHQQVGITESVAQIDSEFASEVPAQFQPATMSNLRILSPSKLSMAPGGANANYLDSYIASSWASFNNTPLVVTLNGRQFSGTTSGSTFTFTEVHPAAANTGEVFVVSQPSTQDVLECAGTMATGVPGNTPQLQDENAKQLQLQNQICSAINRHVLLSPADWTNVSAYYGAAPANFYSQFWHKHSIGGLAYGFSYDDNNNQSTTITTPQPEHMAFGIGW